jgi:hypothetical protein
MTLTPGALRRDELLDMDIAHLGDSQPTASSRRLNRATCRSALTADSGV